MNEQTLLKIQEDIAKQLGNKVDVYHSELYRIIGVFHHGQPPTPNSLIQIIKY